MILMNFYVIITNLFKELNLQAIKANYGCRFK